MHVRYFTFESLCRAKIIGAKPKQAYHKRIYHQRTILRTYSGYYVSAMKISNLLIKEEGVNGKDYWNVL